VSAEHQAGAFISTTPETGCPVSPATYYTAGERAAWDAGAAEAAALLDTRERDQLAELEIEAAWQDECRWAEALGVIHGGYHD
jgi:hypothetical protein